MHSLQNLVLSSLPYEELRGICFSPTPSRIKNIIDCSWEVWRDRALTKYNTPYAYFDLARDRKINGLERYLEVESYYKLTSHSTLRVYSNGFIEGVYESYAGMIEALKRDDPHAVGTFYPRLNKAGREKIVKVYKESPIGLGAVAELSFLQPSPELKEKLERIKADLFLSFPGYTPTPQTDTSKLELLVQKGNRDAFTLLLERGASEELFLSSLLSGKIEFVDALLPYIFPGVNLSVEQVPPPSFTLEGSLPLYDLGVKIPLDEKGMDYLKFSMYSLNPQLVDFFRSLYDVEGLISVDPDLLYLRYRGNPVHVYQILQRAQLSEEDLYMVTSLQNIDLFLYVFSKVGLDYDLVTEIFTNIVGNIPFLITFLHLLEKEGYEIKELNGLINREIYPLSARILDSF